MLLIDKYAYINRLKPIHPLEKMAITLFLLLFTLLVKDKLTSLITFMVMSALTIFVAKIPFAYYLKLLLLPSFFFYPEHCLSYFLLQVWTPSYLLYSGQNSSDLGNYSLQQIMLTQSLHSSLSFLAV